MSVVLHRVAMYACVAALLLISLHTSHNYVTAAPSSRSDRRDTARLTYLLAPSRESLLNDDLDSGSKRNRFDGGYFSRHDALSDYIQSVYANELAADPYGPGKRK